MKKEQAWRDGGIAFGILFVVVFASIFFSKETVFCVTDDMCLHIARMGKLGYTVAVSGIMSATVFVILLIAKTTWVVMWSALMSKPYLVFASVSALTFLGLAAAQVGKHVAGVLTPFQERVFLYVTVLDVCMTGAIIALCVLRERKKKPLQHSGAIAFLMACVGIFFANMLTLPGDIYGWSDAWFFGAIVACAYLFLLTIRSAKPLARRR